MAEVSMPHGVLGVHSTLRMEISGLTIGQDMPATHQLLGTEIRGGRAPQ
jgi:hypothetical protein